MSRVVELHAGLIKDPAYVLEFAKLEEELTRLKAMARMEADKAAGHRQRERTADDAPSSQARKRIA